MNGARPRALRTHNPYRHTQTHKLGASQALSPIHPPDPSKHDFGLPSREPVLGSPFAGGIKGPLRVCPRFPRPQARMRDGEPYLSLESSAAMAPAAPRLPSVGALDEANDAGPSVPPRPAWAAFMPGAEPQSAARPVHLQGPPAALGPGELRWLRARGSPASNSWEI